MPARLFEGKNKESEESWKFSYPGVSNPDADVQKPHLVIPLAREKSVNTGKIIHDEVEWEKQRDQRAIDYKRNARQLIEQCRWVAMNKSFQKEQALVAVKAAKSRITRHSVDYNPITLQYLENDQGKQLESLDQERKRCISERAHKLYLKNNTYNPVVGEPIRDRESVPKDQKWNRHH